MEDGDGRRIQAHPILGELSQVEPVTIEFDGRSIPARPDEPIATALLAAGIRIFRTTPGSGEPRGGYCMVGRCADCLMTVDGVLNVRACITPVRHGMRVKTQHGLGSWADVDPTRAGETAS